MKPPNFSPESYLDKQNRLPGKFLLKRKHSTKFFSSISNPASHFLDGFFLAVPIPLNPLAPCLQHHKTTNKPLIDLHHRRTIIKYVAIIRRTEQCDQFSLIEKLVSILNDLVAPTYEIQVMFG